jgi:hypothetical protein
MLRRSRWTRLIPFVAAILFFTGAYASPGRAANRNIVVHFTNNSDSGLTLQSVTLDGGCWTNGESPPQTLAVNQSVDIASESCGVFTGTEFHVSYTLDLGGATMSMHYDNPEIGSDTLDNNAPQGYVFESFGVIEDHTTKFDCNSTTCDGIADDWKINGVTIDPGGGNPPQFIDLPKMGVSLDRPNVFVQLDHMQDLTHNQQLNQAAIDTVIKAFDQDPVTYHGATRSGITLRVDNGPNSTITPGGATWGSLSRAGAIPWTQDFLTGSRLSYSFTNFYTLLKNNFVPTGRLPIFHYAVAGAEMSATGSSTQCYKGDSTSGVTPSTKLGFIVTLGDWTGCVGNQNEQTGTFMHELGHTLGLDHSGGEGDANSVNYKPNYPSIMNYIFQTVGVPRGGTQVFDYSRDTYPNVDETKLTEAGGVNLGSNPSGSGTGHACATKAGITTFTQPALAPVDWNCDTIVPNGGTGFDANADGSQTVLKGTTTSDWNRIQFKTGGVGAGAGAKDTVSIPSSGDSGPVNELTFEMARLSRVLPLGSKLTYNGASSGDYHDPTTLSASLVDPGDPVTPNSPIPGRTIDFQIGSSATDTCSGITDSTGTASCTISPTQQPGPYTITASFAGDTIYKPSSDASQSFVINKEETSVTLTGQTVILAGSGGATLSGLLVEDGMNDNDNDPGSPAPNPDGQTITFTIGGQSCHGTTDATGSASCLIPSVSSAALGPQTMKAIFAGDAYYTSSSASGQALVFAFPTSGAFVLGDNSLGSSTVTWWSDNWNLLNSLSGGPAPAAFKGIASSVNTLPSTTPANVCLGTWTTTGGNSPPPPRTVPAYMGVIVASSITKPPGSIVNGNYFKIVVVKTNPGYAPDPFDAGTGTIVATFCG